MNFIAVNWYLILVALVSGGMLLVPLIKGGPGGGVSPAQAVQLVNREKGVLIDICSGDEYARGHAAGARHVPLDAFEANLPASVKNKALPLVLVCASGARASRAAGMARKLGYSNVQTLAGGLKAWRDANLPIEKT